MWFIWFSSLVFILVYSQTWSESGANDGIIYYQSNDSYVRNGWAYDWSIFSVDYFTFKSGCCSANDMIILIDRDGDWQKIFQFDSGSDSMTMNSFTIINTNNGMQHCLDTDNMKNGLNFYLGCFESTYYSYDGTNYTCRTYLDDSKYTTVEIYSSSFALFGDSADQLFTMRYHEKTSDQFYIFVGGVGSQSIDFDFQPSMSDSYLTKGVYYLFTTDQNANLVSQDTPSGYVIINICSRKDIFNRYGMVKNSTTITDCSCTFNNEQTTISSTTSFNYPDCNYNSSTLDLTLPTISNTYSLSDDLLSWHSIIFTTSSQSIEINEGQTLTIDELNINQESISFNQNVNVEDLTIKTIGASFNILNFENIAVPIVNDNDIIFTIQSTNTDLSIFGLEQKDGEVKIGICFYNGTNYVNRSYNNYVECSLLKNYENNNLNLQINSPFYSISVPEYWKDLKIFDSDVKISGTAQLKVNTCEFENKTITIDGDLYCTTMNINSNTKLIVNGELTIDTLVITDEIDNLNENGIIESYGSIQIILIKITTSQSNCYELISSNDSLSRPSINPEDYLTLLLSQNNLLRICPLLNTNYEVKCTIIGNTFEQESFDLLHCPCIDEYCTINVNTSQLDTRNIEFDGTFNILTNSSIAISYKTSLFNINLENNKETLLIGNGAVGFETSLNSNSLKSETKTLSIQSSNQIYCKALLIQYDNQQCIINDNTTYPNVGDIYNCQSQNGFGCEICYEGYESNITYCNECPSNCLRCYNGECINCEMNYYVNGSSECSTINEPIITYENEKAIKCNDGYYSNGNECIQCSDSNCVSCNSSTCLTCNTNYTLNNGNCQSKEESNGEEVLSNYGVINCIVGYYSNNSQCIDCSLTFDNCEICNINGCLSCSNGVIINNGSCSLNTNCLNIGDSICLSCNDGSWFNGNDCISCGDNCKNCINGYCIECNDGYILQSENNCVDTNEYPNNCSTLSYYGTCQRCSNEYYLNNNFCYSCPEHCTTCHNLTYCFECNDGYMLNDNNECVDINTILSNCQQPIPGSLGGCAICNDGYYRNQTTCKSCISNCTKCNNGESCLICESDYFLLNDASECISYDELNNCETKTPIGCTECINNSCYLNNQYCTSCSNTTENCDTCNNNGECLTCQNDYILINYECIDYQLIDNCKESKDSKCTACSFWHTLNEDKTGCNTQVVWWVVVLIVFLF